MKEEKNANYATIYFWDLCLNLIFTIPMILSFEEKLRRAKKTALGIVIFNALTSLRSF
jgi:hypothetical protein